MICFKNKFIFTHITKTGGVSVHNRLKSRCDFKNSDRYHRTILGDKEIIESYDKNDRIENYFKFCIVRNPWARYVSQYFYRINARSSSNFFAVNNKWTKKDILEMSFKDMLIALYKSDNPKNNNMNGLPVYDYHLGGRQLNWVKDEEGKVVVDYVCKFENLQDHFDVVCEKIGIEKTELQKLNKGKYKKPYYEYYDDETIEIVANHAKEDIEHFGYKFGE